MTNPQRQAATNKLIEAVGHLRSRIVYDDNVATGPLGGVVDAYDQLMRAPLDDPGPPKTRTSAPLTAHFAGQSMRAPSPTIAQRIVRRMYWQPAHPNGPGWTVEELELTLVLKHQTCSPRVNELRNAGWIYAKGDTRKNLSGREAEIYRLTARAVELIEEARSQS